MNQETLDYESTESFSENMDYTNDSSDYATTEIDEEHYNHYRHKYSKQIENSESDIITKIKSNTITSLILGKCDNNENLIDILNELSNNKSVSELNLCIETLEFCDIIADTLSKNDSIESLQIYFPKINIAKILECLHSNRNIYDLNFKGYFNYNNIRALAELISKSHSLKCMELNNCYLYSKKLKHLIYALCKNSSITKLNLRNNNYGTLGCKHIGKLLNENSTLRELFLTDCKIDVDGFKYISRSLRKNSSLNHLDLSNNNINCRALKYITKSMSMNTSLQILKLNNCHILRRNAYHIVNMIKNKTSLQELHLSDNKIGKYMFKIVDSLKNNKSLNLINLSNNYYKCPKNIVFKLNFDLMLQHVDLSSDKNDLYNGVKYCLNITEYIETVIIMSKRLKYLNIANIFIKINSSIIESICRCNTLIHLNIIGNSIETKLLGLLIRNCVTLKTLKAQLKQNDEYIHPVTESLCTNTNLVELQLLLHNPEHIKNVAESLVNNYSLRSFRIICNAVNANDNLDEIEQILENNYVLTEFNICKEETCFDKIIQRNIPLEKKSFLNKIIQRNILLEKNKRFGTVKVAV